ncbi:MAG: Bax inhibitor-1/YccA family protein [Gammaproteobacteria bacterium]|nr:Bax inhibitor-1/YccA family protein [Gammaproteobacteria bacterium]
MNPVGGRHGVVIADRQNAVLRNTYRLLSATLGFSALVAAGSAALSLPHPGLLLTLGGYFGLLFLTMYLRNSAWGLVSVFGLTGFMGYTLGPIISAYLSLPGGTSIVMLAMGATAAIFLGVSAYARSERAVDMLGYSTFLTVGILTAFALGLGAIFFDLPALSLAVSGMFILLMTGLIMFETQNIVRGGETNYIMATVTLFVSIYNLFASFLHLIGFAADEA